MRTVIDLFHSAFSDTANGGGSRLVWRDRDLSPSAAEAWGGPPSDADGWADLAGGEVRDHVHRLAAGLISLGVSRGERVALMMVNRPEQWLSDLAVLHAGAVPTTFYPTLAPEQVAVQCAQAGVHTVILQGAEQLERWADALEQGLIERLILVSPAEGDALPASVTALTYREVLEAGAAHLDADPQAVDRRAGAVTGEDPATIIFTSGTTGAPKGAMLTNENVVAHSSALIEAAALTAPYVTLSHLPFAHVADRAVSLYLALTLHGTVYFSADPTQLPATVRKARPTVLFGVPRLWEKIAALLAAVQDPDPAQVLERAGLDRLAWAPSAGAPMPEHLIRGLQERGVPIVDVWGMTEVAGLATASSTADARLGTVGRALPGVDIRLADDGELLVRGPNVIHSYLLADGTEGNPLDAGGFLPTGDIGEIDGDGFVRVVDRKKELIITSGGKNISPATIESALTASPLISQAFAYGNDHPYIVALVTLEVEAAVRFVEALAGVTPDDPARLAEVPALLSAIAEHIDEVNSHLARPEQVKRWLLLGAPWGPDSGVLTPTLKVKRRAVEQLEAERILGLYAETVAPPVRVSGAGASRG